MLSNFQKAYQIHEKMQSQIVQNELASQFCFDLIFFSFIDNRTRLSISMRNLISVFLFFQYDNYNTRTERPKTNNVIQRFCSPFHFFFRFSLDWFHLKYSKILWIVCDQWLQVEFNHLVRLLVRSLACSSLPWSIQSRDRGFCTL